MDTIEAIRTRRSIRRYPGAPVADDVLSEILTAAMSAPSAGNQQPWQFVVVAEGALREAIAAFHPYAQMVLEAPVAIVVRTWPAQCCFSLRRQAPTSRARRCT